MEYVCVMVFNAMHFQQYFSYIMAIDMQWNLFNTARLSIDKSLICLFIQNIDLNLTKIRAPYIYNLFFSSPGQRPCELLLWVCVRRPSVRLSVRPLAFHI